MSRRTIFPYVGVSMPSSYATGISLTMDENYILTAQLTDQNGNPIGEEQTIDLPLESVVVGGSYDSQTKSLILTLDNGNTISIPISDLINGLQPTIDANNKLNADYIADGTTNKVFTATEQTKLSGIASGAEVNVQSDWNESDNTADSYIKNKPTLGTMASESASDYTPTASLGSMAFANTSDYTPTASLATVATTGQYSDLSGTPTIPAAQIQSDWTQTDNTSLDYIKNKPSLATVATSGAYSDLSGTPTIPTVNDSTITIEQDGVTAGTFTLNQSSNATISLTGGSGGGGNQWFGSQIEFDNLSSYDDNTDYYIKDKIDYRYDISHTPDLSTYATKTYVDNSNAQQDVVIAGKMSAQFMTQQEFDDLGNNVPEGQNIFVQGDTIEVVVTFTDQTTATYNVVID